MMQNSKYTVLMSVYCKEKPEYLSLSIESMLNQTVKPDEFIIYVRMEVEDIHLNRPVRTIVNRRADTYIQHPHIRFPVKRYPYGTYAIGRNKFLRIIYA